MTLEPLLGSTALSGRYILDILPQALDVVGVGVEEVLGEVVDRVVGPHLPFGRALVRAGFVWGYNPVSPVILHGVVSPKVGQAKVSKHRQKLTVPATWHAGELLERLERCETGREGANPSEWMYP